jgi:hypothetical protein
MEKFSGMRYFRLGRHIEYMCRMSVSSVSPDSEDNIKVCAMLCEEISLPLSRMLITERILPEFADGKIPDRTYYNFLLNSLSERIADEMALHLFLYVPPERAKFYEPGKPIFGTDIADKFPSAIFDIEEAGKCLALGRGTACVFHLMRVMEVCLRSLAKGLNIPYAPSWESYLRQIETNITEKHKKKSRAWKREEPFYRDSGGDLQMVKIAWRNPTMHIVRVYTPEEAEDVFRAVRTFMQRLATKFTEAGPIKTKGAKQ